MDVPTFKIERAEEKDRLGRRPRNTRVFTTRLLGYLADSPWEPFTCAVARRWGYLAPPWP